MHDAGSGKTEAVFRWSMCLAPVSHVTMRANIVFLQGMIARKSCNVMEVDLILIQAVYSIQLSSIVPDFAAIIVKSNYLAIKKQADHFLLCLFPCIDKCHQ